MSNDTESIRRTIQYLVTAGQVQVRSATGTVTALMTLTKRGLTEEDIRMLDLIIQDAKGKEPHKAWDDYLTDVFNDGNQSFTWKLGVGTAGAAAMATDAFAGPTHLSNELVIAAGIVSAVGLLGGAAATIQQRLMQRNIPRRRILGHQYLLDHGIKAP